MSMVLLQQKNNINSAG